MHNGLNEGEFLFQNGSSKIVQDGIKKALERINDSQAIQEVSPIQ